MTVLTKPFGEKKSEKLLTKGLVSCLYKCLWLFTITMFFFSLSNQFITKWTPILCFPYNFVSSCCDCEYENDELFFEYYLPVPIN